MEKRIYQDSRTAYLIIEPETDISDSLSMNMMKNNKIQCLLDMECRYVDNNLALYYKIQGLQCMKEYMEEYNLDYNTARQLYLDIIQAIVNGEEFFLNDNSYVLDLEYIYWDKKNKCAKLCCIPEWHGDFQKDIKKLAENIITYINHNDKAAEKFIYGIYSLITDNGFIIPNVKSYIKEFKPNGAVPSKHSSYSIKDVKNVSENDIESALQKPLKKDEEAKITKKYILCIEKASMPLSNWKKGKVCIGLNDICNNTGENYCKISVGRCDECGIVFPYGVISRYHAIIHIIDEKFYIEDTESTNGTYLNGQKIPANVKTLCNDNDVISFAGINCRVTGK